MLFLCINAGNAQDRNTDSFRNKKIALQFSYQYGYVFPTNDFVRGNNAEADTVDDFQSFALKITKQTTGKKLWQQLYNYPEYGLGLYLADFYNPEEIGFPIAVHGYFTAPFFRGERLMLNYEFGLGMAFNWKNYSPSNPYNKAIGAKYTVYLDLGLKLEYRIYKQLSMDLGFSLTHFSNGNLKEPNYGLNTIAPKIGAKYNFNPEHLHFIEQEIRKYKKHNEWYVAVFGGLKNILYDSLNIDASEKFEGESYSVFGISTIFNRQISYKSKVGIGLDIAYDGSLNAQVAVDKGELDVHYAPFIENILVSAFPSYELEINRVSLIFQPSFYIYRKDTKNQSPAFYQRIGLKYNFYENLYMGINLRAYHFSVSDFIEWNIGYRIK
ncbi:MAG: acyloxyacyl hydrolase [Chlorobi bacterium]|nr:acyloxyacyl hydrolase [Chlorobiota bacterium]